MRPGLWNEPNFFKNKTKKSPINCVTRVNKCRSTHECSFLEKKGTLLDMAQTLEETIMRSLGINIHYNGI